MAVGSAELPEVAVPSLGPAGSSAVGRRSMGVASGVLCRLDRAAAATAIPSSVAAPARP